MDHNDKFTHKTIVKFISISDPPKKVGIFHEGRFFTAYGCQSKTTWGVKYNRLIRLSAKIRKFKLK